MFSAWGHLVYRFRWAFLIVSAALMALSVAVSASGGDLKSGGIIQTSESGWHPQGAGSDPRHNGSHPQRYECESLDTRSQPPDDESRPPNRGTRFPSRGSRFRIPESRIFAVRPRLRADASLPRAGDTRLPLREDGPLAPRNQNPRRAI